jgi:hypothetical protein
LGWLWWSLGVALVEPWGGLGGALGWLWWSLEVALGCLCGAYQQALGWPWGGLGWLCAALFPISAFSFQHFSFCRNVALCSPLSDFSFQHFSFCPIVALGWLACPVTNHESRITNHLRLWVASRQAGRPWHAGYKATGPVLKQQQPQSVGMAITSIPGPFHKCTIQRNMLWYS